MFSLNGKSAIVTGAGSGIGLAIAHALAAAGAGVMVAEIDPAAGESAAAEISAAGRAAIHLPCDVRDSGACERAVAGAIARFGQLDILVNNAGIGHVGTVLTTTAADLDRLYSVNVKGVLNMTRPAAIHMASRRAGSIINLASIGGMVGMSDRYAYGATKFAVVGLTKCAALDLAHAGVRVNCICPGRVETPFVQRRLAEYPDPKKAYADMCATQALGRMGTPHEIAAAALYLASDEAAFVTGSALVIDGGFSAGK